MGLWQKLLAALPLVIAALGVVYRRTLYWRIPVAKGDPYGLGDIIDGLFFLVMFIAASITVLAAIIAFVKAQTRAGGVLLLCGVLAYIGYRTLH
jgi:hypothetical protein